MKEAREGTAEAGGQRSTGDRRISATEIKGNIFEIKIKTFVAKTLDLLFIFFCAFFVFFTCFFCKKKGQKKRPCFIGRIVWRFCYGKKNYYFCGKLFHVGLQSGQKS